LDSRKHNPFSILDIGAGTGNPLMLARSNAEQIDALEIDEET
jgi:tRNA1(Val) A37 N6-methylase TrmN6